MLSTIMLYPHKPDIIDLAESLILQTFHVLKNLRVYLEVTESDRME